MEAGKKPAVFVFTTAYHPFVGGAEIAIQEVAKRLTGEFDFFIFTARLRRGLAARETRGRETVVRIGLGRPFDKWLLLFLGPFAAVRELAKIGMARRVLFWGVDVSAGSLVATFVKFLRPRLPFVLTIQYGYGEERLGRGRLGLIGLGFRFMLRRADLLTAISKHLAEVARHFGWQGTVEIIPNGVALESLLFARQDRPVGAPPTIITVSRLVPKNGVDTIIRAMAELGHRVPGIRCRIVGDGPERASLESLARSLGLADAVEFAGEISHTAVAGELAAADIFVRPSRSEGMGNVFVEALAAGLPIIGTPVGGITDIIQDGQTGLFCRVNDPADLAEKILRLFRDRALADRIVANGQRMVRERFSWDTIAAAYHRLFSSAMAARILIATPLVPPAIGGPATYETNLARALAAQGTPVSVISYGTGAMRTGEDEHAFVSSRLPSGIKHLAYGFKALRLLRRADAAIVLDPVIVGMPVLLACRLLAKPYFLRMEGDFLWESFAGRIRADLTLREFAEQRPELPLSWKERLAWRAARAVLRKADRVISSSAWRREITEREYQTGPLRAAIIESPWSAAGRGQEERERVILYAGRFIWIKNLERLIRAFLAATHPSEPDNSRDRVNYPTTIGAWRLELVGEGPERTRLERLVVELAARGRIIIRPPLAPDDLGERLRSVRALAIPSLSDVSPRIVLEAIAAGTPFLLTRESGFAEALANAGLLADPRDEADIAAKLRQLMDDRASGELRERLGRFKRIRSWDQVADDWLNIIHATINE